MPEPPLPARGPADISSSVTAAAKAAYVTTARSADAQTEAATDTDAAKQLATAPPTALDFAGMPTSLQPGMDNSVADSALLEELAPPE